MDGIKSMIHNGWNREIYLHPFLEKCIGLIRNEKSIPDNLKHLVGKLETSEDECNILHYKFLLIFY